MTRRQIKLIALREITTRGRSRGFRIITALMLLLAVVAPILASLIPSPTESLRQVTIGIGEGASEQLQPVLEVLGADAFELEFRDLGALSRDRVDALLDNGEIDVAIEPPRQLAWAETEISSLRSLISAGINQVEALERAGQLGLDIDDLSTVFTPTELDERFVSASTNTESVRQGVAFFGLFLAFLLPQIFGQLTMLSVVEEKSTRVVEVLLSQIRPRTLLVGKILGLCSLAVVQLVLIIAGLLGSLLTISAIDVPASVWRFVPLLALSVFAGLALYTTLFALLGSLISRQEDAAQVMLPIFAPLMVGYFVGQAAIFGNADSIGARIMTWIPLTAPMLLPVRVARDAIGPIELAISIALMALMVWFLIRLASRLYEFTLLRTGARVGWRETIRLSRGSVLE